MSYTVLAKGSSDNYMSLYDHTEHVVQAIVPFAEQFGFDSALAKRGAVLHDLGKAHPAFQAMLIEKPIAKREEWLCRLSSSNAVRTYLELRDESPQVYRHELGSLGFLSLFSREEWPALIEMVVGHHKSVRNDKSGRGLLDLADYKKGSGIRVVVEDHIAYWEEWSPAAIAIAGQFGVHPVSITKEEAINNFMYAYEYVLGLASGRSLYRGLLMAADHFASGSKYRSAERAAKLFGSPDHSAFLTRKHSERAHLYPLSSLATDDPRPHTIVTAPTGAGKTDFLVSRSQGRIFYTLPFQASINSMHQRFVADMPSTDVRRLHSASKVNLDTLELKGKEFEEEVDLQNHPGAAVKVLTPHQLVALALCTPGHEVIALDVAGQDVVLDEVHTYSDEARTMIIKIVQALLSLECRIHIGTATLPLWLDDRLHSMLGGEEWVQRIVLPPEVLDTFDRHIIHKTYQGELLTDDHILAIVTEAKVGEQKLLIVANRVARAQQLYKIIKTEAPDVPVVLIHSRYRRKDRAQLEAEVVRLQEKDRKGAAIAIATQVVEVSLDISFDCMISDAAPLDALIQRFGRVNRRRSSESIGKYRPIYVLPPPTEDKVLPYTLPLVKESYAALPDGEVLRERNVQGLMNRVFKYAESNVVSTAYKIAEDGSCLLNKLQHQPRSTVVSVLKIEGYTCVTDEDLPEYRKADFQTKPNYEIPVGKSFIRYCLPIEESGSYPFILPKKFYHFDNASRVGLSMEEVEQPVKSQIL